jgi:GT2 family glycosyltransferase
LATTFSIVIPTRDRQPQITRLLDSIRCSTGLEQLHPEIIIGDNGSSDRTWEMLQQASIDFPVPMRLFQIPAPGKCKVLNQAIKIANGEILAFLDDDVIVQADWLEALDKFFSEKSHLAAQGAILIPPEDLNDPEVGRLIQRFRTAHHLEYHRSADNLNSLNGANMAIRREVFARVGDFDVRLGPGASGTSEDVELAQRIRHAGIKIGYIPNAVVYHELDRVRLTEAYFKALHQRQGVSRLTYKDQSASRIIFDLCRVSAQYVLYSLFGAERNRYRSKGRVYHYRAMLQAKLGIHSPQQPVTRDQACFRSSEIR